jgi:hypothetical protein
MHNLYNILYVFGKPNAIVYWHIGYWRDYGPDTGPGEYGG